VKITVISSLFKKRYHAPVKILGVRQTGEKVYLKVSMAEQYYEYLYRFLKEKGLIGLTGGKDGISLMLEYGLTEIKEEDREKQWDIEKMSRYATACFKSYELFEKNCAIATGLRFHLLENKILKKRLRERGLEHLAGHDEWDDWNDSKTAELYNRYLYCR